MSLFDALQQSGLIHRLGWGLVHSLWLGIVIAVALALLLRLLRGRSANMRYLACCGAMVALLAATIGAVSLVQSPARTPEVSAVVPMPEAAPAPSLPLPAPTVLAVPNV